MSEAGALASPRTVRRHLVACAKEGRPITYSQMLARLGHPFSRPRMRALCRTLEAVDRGARRRGEPELAVLVVRQSDGLPGQGWWIGAGQGAEPFAHRWDGPEARAHVERLQARAFAYWQARD